MSDDPPTPDQPKPRPPAAAHARARRPPATPARRVTVLPPVAVPLDAEHKDRALRYLAELLAPLFGADGAR